MDTWTALSQTGDTHGMTARAIIRPDVSDPACDPTLIMLANEQQCPRVCVLLEG